MIREIMEALKRRFDASLEKIEALDLTEAADVEPTVPVPSEAYAVTGEPRRIPWHIRKKQLEAGARKKRQQRDEYRSIA